MASTVRVNPKKLIVLCDGTWQNSDVGWEKDGLFDQGHPQIPTNVTRIARAILAEDKKGISQVICYQAGVGTGFSVADHLLGGGLALGLSENIREAYGFCVHNYHQADDLSVVDEIFLLGFSRGAFTARSVGGMIGSIGLITKDAMQYFYSIFEDFENAGSHGYEPKLPGVLPGFNLKVDADVAKDYLNDYKAELLRHGLTREVKIQAIGVWDTVGTLGLPIQPWLQKLGLPTTLHSYRFYDTGIGSHVLNAFQALAMDERRAAFQATVWEKLADNKTTNLKQVWFPGVHSNIGGGYSDTSMADMTLAWMMSQLESFLDFNESYLLEQVALNKKANYPLQGATNKSNWQWGMGELYNSLTFPTSLGGSADRTPGTYHVLNYDTGKSTSATLQDTNEYMHASVRARVNFNGKDCNNRDYRPDFLQDWKQTTSKAADGGVINSWIYKGQDAAVQRQVMEAAPLGTFEKLLLNEDPEMKERLFAGA